MDESICATPELSLVVPRLNGDLDDLPPCGIKEAALKEVDARVGLTKWQAFRAPSGRNPPARLARRGFGYDAIGRGTR